MAYLRLSGARFFQIVWRKECDVQYVEPQVITIGNHKKTIQIVYEKTVVMLADTSTSLHLPILSVLSQSLEDSKQSSQVDSWWHWVYGNVNPGLINPRLFICGGYHFNSRLLLFGGTTTITQPGLINPGLTLYVSIWIGYNHLTTTESHVWWFLIGISSPKLWPNYSGSWIILIYPDLYTYTHWVHPTWQTGYTTSYMEHPLSPLQYEYGLYMVYEARTK